MAKFDTSIRDSQATTIIPIAPEKFDLQAYVDYEQSLLERNKEFVRNNSGIQVYRRVRADGVFFDGCRDRETSLALQLGALKYSMAFQADIANFLEPWYGIGYIASCFGGEYIWTPNQAPSVQPMFECCEDILNAGFKPIAQTPVGRENLNMIEYFLDKTKGELPMSFSDLQSPLNMLSYLLSMNDLFMDVVEDPDSVQKAAELVTDLLIDYMKIQQDMIGDALAKPGHGFASSRAFKGAGLSDDISLMLSADDYSDLFQPSFEKIGAAFGGAVYHSCGNWKRKIDMVKGFSGITTVDGAFSAETDPSPNDPADFADAFAGTGIVVNARAVGNADDAYNAFSKLWRPNQKMIAVTYCRTPEEQAELYRRLHQLASGR